MAENSAMADELCRFVVLHSRAQQLDEALLQRTLREITLDAGDGFASWPVAWSRLGDAAVAAGKEFQAIKLYNLARFPFVDGPARHMAHARCVETFGRWAEKRGIERWDFDDPSFAAYAAGLDRNRPVTIVTGGIVSIKEQWHRLLSLAPLLGQCVVVSEMAQVGENRSEYAPGAPPIHDRILNRLEGRANVNRVQLLAFSFSGHLALRAAIGDPRVCRVITVGAPVHHYFTDPDWHGRLPLLTRTTLARMLGCSNESLFGRMREWALTSRELKALDCPVDYLASAQDEVIPSAEYGFLGEHVKRLQLLLVDDVHGSPNHARLTALWVATCLLRACGARIPWKACLSSVLLGKEIRQAGARMVMT